MSVILQVFRTPRDTDIMASSGTGTWTGTPTGFMAEYMSDLKQSQDLTSFLQQNQPTYNPTTSSASATPAGTDLSSARKDASAKSGSTDESSDTNNTSSSSSSSSSTPSSFSSTSSDPTTRSLDGKSTAASHQVPNAHAIYQRHATQGAAIDNCADLNMELADCLSGKAGTWWDRASMCMKAKERFGKCCRLNREVLEKKGYAREGNTKEQNQEIQDYADDFTQKAMKDDVEG